MSKEKGWWAYIQFIKTFTNCLCQSLIQTVGSSSSGSFSTPSNRSCPQKLYFLKASLRRMCINCESLNLWTVSIVAESQIENPNLPWCHTALAIHLPMSWCNPQLSLLGDQMDRPPHQFHPKVQCQGRSQMDPYHLVTNKWRNGTSSKTEDLRVDYCDLEVFWKTANRFKGSFWFKHFSWKVFLTES